jgi:pimeloyl-ACP methyl ester carboxylesterase
MDRFDRDGLRFDVSDSGPADGRPVVLLHGFPTDRTSWDAVTPALVDRGCRVLAPDQRGYSPGARPPRRRDYRLDLLAADVLALADAAGAERFDVVGHDWGAVVALHLAARHPDRVRTVAALAGPHPEAWRRSLIRSAQAVRSAYMVFFQVPLLPERLLAARSGAWLYRTLVRTGLDREHARRYASRMSRPGALTGPLHWYRAAAFAGGRTPAVPVPTLFVRGGRDRFITPAAVDLSRRWVSGPCRVETFEDASHWIPEQAPARVAELITGHR